MARRISVEFRPPLVKLEKKFQRFNRRLTDLEIPHRKIGVILGQWVLRNFRKQGQLAGGWKRFKIGGRWIKLGGKRTFDSSAKLLQDTGRLRASFVSFSDDELAGIGSDLPRSEWHEFGTVHIPARRMLPEQRDIHKKAKAVYVKHIKETMQDILDSQL